MKKPKSVSKTSKVKKVKAIKIPSRKRLVSELDTLNSANCCIGQNGVCMMCGKAGTQAHHFFGKKAHGSVRWEQDNMMWLCFYCHIIRIHRGGEAEEARDKLIEKIGKERFDKLKGKAHQVVKYSIQDLMSLRERLSKGL